MGVWPGPALNSGFQNFPRALSGLRFAVGVTWEEQSNGETQIKWAVPVQVHSLGDFSVCWHHIENPNKGADHRVTGACTLLAPAGHGTAEPPGKARGPVGCAHPLPGLVAEGPTQVSRSPAAP